MSDYNKNEKFFLESDVVSIYVADVSGIDSGGG